MTAAWARDIWLILICECWAPAFLLMNMCIRGMESIAVRLGWPPRITKSPCTTICSGCMKGSLHIWETCLVGAAAFARRRNIAMTLPAWLLVLIIVPDVLGAISKIQLTAYPTCKVRRVNGNHGGADSTTTMK